MIGNSKKKQETSSQKAILRALVENYECIYVIDVETSAYRCFHESDPYSSLCIDECGEDFFKTLEESLSKTIYADDQSFVRRMLTREALLAGFEKDRFYSFVYRLVIDGKPLYHKLRATTDFIDGRRHFLIGIRNVDAAFRQDKELAEKLSSMKSKEVNHLEAVLASAEGYLDANLTRDSILEVTPDFISTGLPDHVHAPKMDNLSYSDFEKWRIDNLVVENKEKYIEISDRKYLLNCFTRGEKRASVSFSMKTENGREKPCKKFFFLHQDAFSGDVLSFCVLYDLTEQQRKEKELRDLENELQMSRLRNFTSQMQPHFLYNALGSIQEVVLDDPKYASELIGDFTTHLRSCIRAMANDAPIPFEQELANIRAYTNIEKMRFGDKLKILYDIQTDDFRILPLSVQPIVENAIRHGIYERGERGGTVRIKTEPIAGAVCVTVEDDGVGFDVDAYRNRVAAERADSTGLKNIMFRLDKMMHASVSISSRIGKGTVVTITIPKGEQET